MEVRNLFFNNEGEALAQIFEIGADKLGGRLMAPKGVFRVLKLNGLTPVQANILKQEMLARGAEAAVSRGVIDGSASSTDVVLMGTSSQYKAVLLKLKMQAFGLPKLADQIEEVLDNLEKRPAKLSCKDRDLYLGKRTLLMGILNTTPDSFSDGEVYLDPGKAEERAFRMVEEGADIIDVGGESTRPGYTAVSLEEELKRVMPVLKRISGKIPVPVSIDTSKAETARRSLEMGVQIVNDQQALRGDPQMPGIVAQYKAAVIIMHNQQGTEYKDMLGEMVHYFRESMDIAEAAGINRDAIVIDPGVGFGKTAEGNLEAILKLPELACLGRPVLVGTSRKSVIGKVLDLPVDQRLEGTAATVALSIAGGADIVRVHDVKEMARVVKMADAVVRRNFGKD
ncbi:MAG TPA: dihydropteroate synthase [Desulfotomaculum sp.]|nr:MAG: Dihydropteroate synthase [Desulfotomaculum sp. 46_80]HAG10391.1 dihydropteroate synthase [Desulfotomaculum sp.]HBY04180.1 dihydropteroate synthase [Desulfotomaculum sp.]